MRMDIIEEVSSRTAKITKWKIKLSLAVIKRYCEVKAFDFKNNKLDDLWEMNQ